MEKILVRYESDVLDEVTVETLWAEATDKAKGIYKVKNIPFYGPPFSYDDEVFVEYDPDEEFLTFRKVVTPSGNITLAVMLLEEIVEINAVISTLEHLGASVERATGSYFVANVPFEVVYTPIYTYLTEQEQAGALSFQESNLSEKHWKESNE